MYSIEYAIIIIINYCTLIENVTYYNALIIITSVIIIYLKLLMEPNKEPLKSTRYSFPSKGSYEKKIGSEILKTTISSDGSYVIIYTSGQILRLYFRKLFNKTQKLSPDRNKIYENVRDNNN